MKLILKNLKQIQYEIYVESDKITVNDLKKEIEKLYLFDSEQIKLFHNGTILENQKILSDYKITENSTIILMNTKTKKLDSVKAIELKPRENPPKTSQIKVATENANKSNISKILNDNLTIQVNSLVEMGFEKTQVVAAVKAANGRIDLAIEYLNNGIPDNINNSNINRTKVESEITKELKKQAGVIKMLCKEDKNRIFEILNNIKKNDPGLLRLITDYQNEFKNYLNSPITEEDIMNYENLEQKADRIEKQREEKRKKKKEERERLKKEKKEKKEQEKQKIENESNNIQKKYQEEKKDDDKEKDNIIGDKKEDILNIKLKKDENKECNENKEEIDNKNNFIEKMEKNDSKKEENQIKKEIEVEGEKGKNNNEIIKNKNDMEGEVEGEEKNGKKIKQLVNKEHERNNESIEYNENKNLKENKEEKKEEKENNNEIVKENNELTKNNVITNENKDKEKNNNNSLINQLSEEEKLIVNKIKDLGNFSLDKVVEAFIVCNKNEELTANFLFEQ